MGKYESIRGVNKREQQPNEGEKSEPKSEEAKEENDAKRLRLDRSSTKQEATKGEGKDEVEVKVKGEVVEEMGVDGVADQPEDKDSQVRGVFLFDPSVGVEFVERGCFLCWRVAFGRKEELVVDIAVGTCLGGPRTTLCCGGRVCKEGCTANVVGACMVQVNRVCVCVY